MFDAAIAISTELAEVVKRLVLVPPEPTFTVIGTEVPLASNTKTCAVPVTMPLMLKEVPETLALATPVLLLLAVYGALPPPIVKLFVSVAAMVMELAAVVYNAVVTPPEPTVTDMLKVVPVVSNICTCEEPAAMPEMRNELPLIATVATAVLLLLTRYPGLPPAIVKDEETFAARVSALGAVVNNSVGVTPPLTVTAMITLAPAASLTVICAVPAATLIIFSVVPLTLVVATLVLLLLDLYVAVPPPMV